MERDMSNDSSVLSKPKITPEFMEPSLSYGGIKRDQAEKAGNTQPSAFKVRAQLLDQGRTDTVLAASANLTLRLKVYASGGENALHAHENEDHFFIILQGTADFFDPDGLLAALGPHEGIMLPKGQQYSFNATSAEPLVMLRIGSPNESVLGLEGRVGVDGAPMAGDSKANKTVERKFRPGAFFG
jgi:mannose-6-phosphate isomerase-like protein (cupin superfamily)